MVIKIKTAYSAAVKNHKCENLKLLCPHAYLRYFVAVRAFFSLIFSLVYFSTQDSTCKIKLLVWAAGMWSPLYHVGLIINPMTLLPVHVLYHVGCTRNRALVVADVKDRKSSCRQHPGGALHERLLVLRVWVPTRITCTLATHTRITRKLDKGTDVHRMRWIDPMEMQNRLALIACKNYLTNGIIAYWLPWNWHIWSRWNHTVGRPVRLCHIIIIFYTFPSFVQTVVPEMLYKTIAISDAFMAACAFTSSFWIQPRNIFAAVGLRVVVFWRFVS